MLECRCLVGGGWGAEEGAGGPGALTLGVCVGKGGVRIMQKVSVGQSLKWALPLLPTSHWLELTTWPTQLQGRLGNVVLAACPENAAR